MSDSGELSGRLVDTLLSPIAGVTVKVQSQNVSTTTSILGTFSFITVPSFLKNNPEKHSEIKIYGNTLQFKAFSKESLRIDLYTISGVKLETIFNRNMELGQYSLSIPSLMKKNAQGIYFVKIIWGSQSMIHRLAVSKPEIDQDRDILSTDLFKDLKKSTVIYADSLTFSKLGFITKKVGITSDLNQNLGDIVLMALPVVVTHPSWLVSKQYTSDYSTVNNFKNANDETGILFNGPPLYTYEEMRYKNWSVKGTWEVHGESLKLIPTSGIAQSFNLKIAFGASCRVFTRSTFDRYYSWGSHILNCPYSKTMTTAECNVAGNYKKVENIDAESGSHSDYTTIYELDSDGFIRYITSSNSYTCFNFQCSTTINNRPTPLFGQWWLDGNILKSDIVSVNVGIGFTFTKSILPCGK